MKHAPLQFTCCLSTLLLLASAPATLAADYAETANGDLSSDRLAPTPFLLSIGANTLAASTASGDLEFFTAQVPAGVQLNRLTLDSYVSDDIRAFMGVVAGSTFPTDPNTTSASELLGYTHLGPIDTPIGADFLPTLGSAFQAQGFVPPLPAGNYTFWIQQFGGDTAYSMTFSAGLVPEPAVGCIVGTIGALLLRRRPR